MILTALIDKMAATVPWLPIGAAPRTLSLWAKARPDAARSVSLAEWGLPQNGQAFGIANGNSPYTWTGKTGGAAPGVNSGVVVDSKWHHLCLTYGDGILAIYLDGVLKQTAAEVINTGLSALTMGVGVEGSTYYPGSLDEVRVYNRALSASDVQQLKASEDPDTDHDGILDRFETGTGIFFSAEDTGTSPTIADSDVDGLSDGAEVNTHHSDPNITDTDGDGFADGFEVNTGFDPASTQSTPDALSTLRPAREFRFNAANSVSYRIEGPTDTQNWTTLETNITGAGGVVTRFFVEEDLGPRYFLRVRRN